MSFRLSFHQPLLRPTGAHLPDDPPDVSCKDSTGQHTVDGWPLSCKQQVGGSSPPPARITAGQRPATLALLGRMPFRCHSSAPGWDDIGGSHRQRQGLTGRFSRPPGLVVFERLCRERGIIQRFTKVRSTTTTGKIERFHKTIQAELLAGRVFADLAQAQAAVHAWVAEYNTRRPHQALQMRPPAERFHRPPAPQPAPGAAPRPAAGRDRGRGPGVGQPAAGRPGRAAAQDHAHPARG